MFNLLAIHLWTWMACFILMTAAQAQVSPISYRVESVPTPPDIAPEVSGITFAEDGKLYACFRRGYVYSLDLQSQEWKRFASGFQTPLGILAGKPREFFVGHFPEVTRISDEDGDGEADLYETVADEWGMSGNYHEFVSGPVRDAAGNLYVSLGCSSNFADPRTPVRGKYTEQGHVAKEQEEGYVNKVGHYSPTPFRGCVLKITPDRTVVPLACGLRQPNGIGINHKGEIFVTDNQGDWVGTSPLYHVTEEAFLGHPAALNWLPAFKGHDPVEASIEELARLRKLPAIQFPQNDMGGSVAQPLFDETGGKFGPYAGQVFVAEWTYARILRAYLEKVDGQYQGAAFIFMEGNGLQKGNNRLAFSPDGGALYVAQTSRLWGSVEGLQRIEWTGEAPMDILSMELTAIGFDLTFTKPVDPETARDPSHYSITYYYYLYHAQYGSPKTGVTPVAVNRVSVSEDGLKVSLELEGLVSKRVYELRPRSIQSAKGEPLVTRIAAYTVNRLR